MANEIYSSSWWGNGVCDNTIDWGISYKDLAGCTPSFVNTYSMNFDGVDDYITMDGASSVFSSAYSVSFWFNADSFPTGGPGGRVLFSLHTSAGGNLLLLYADTFGRLVTFNNVSTRTNSVGSTTSTGTWNHCVITSDGTNMKVYKNGSLEDTNASGNFTTGTVAKVSLGQEWDIGTPSDFYNGYLDEVAYFNSEISASDVTSIYNSGTPTTITGASAWYRMGENGSWKSPQWLLPQETNKDKVSNYSFLFDGIDDYITCSNFNSLASVNTFTVSFWAKFNTVALNDTLLNHYSTLGFRADAQNNKMTFRWSSSDSTTVLVQSTNTITTGTWKHYACTYDNTDFKLYENGSLISTTNEPSKTYRSNLNQNLLMGKYWFGLQRLFDGQLAQVAVWDSVQNITSIYNSGTPTTITGATNYWKMGEGATFSTNWTIPETIGSSTGTSNAMTIEDRVGEAPNSSGNSVSFNMVEADRETDVPS